MEFVLLALAVIGLMVHSAEVHIALLVVHTLVALWLAWKLVGRQPISALFIAYYVLMYFPNPLAIMTGLLPPDTYERPEILYSSTALLMIGLDLFIFGARRLRFTRLDANRMPRFQARHFPIDICIALALALCVLTAAVLTTALAGMGVNVFTIPKSWISGFGAHNLYYRAANYAFLTLPLVVFLIGLKRPSLQLPYLIPVGLLLTFHFMVFRVRSPFIAVIVAYIVATIARSFVITTGSRPPPGRISPQMRMLFLIGAPTLVFLGVAIKYMRHSYAMDDYRISPKRVQELVVSTFAGGDLGQSFFLRRAIVLFPERHRYLRGQSYYRLLFLPIPRSLWPGKPVNTARIFAAEHDPALRKRNSTIPPGIVGDLYINFGPVGVLGMVLWGLILAQERYRNLTDLMYLAGSGWWLFHIVRGSVSVPVAFLIAMWIVAYAFNRIIRPTVLREAPGPPPIWPAATDQQALRGADVRLRDGRANYGTPHGP
ncbi:MAG: hypothetical protein IH986_04650 [Planctomycetes bacterium]|nr:hypothetical protein [Planctomycetota bacterium]